MATEPGKAESQPDDPRLELLMERYQAGDGEAAEALVQQVSPRIFQFFLSLVSNRPVAEDLLQDFWVRIVKARHTYRLGEPIWPWLFAIARRTQIDSYRRRSRVSRHELQGEQLPERPVAPKELQDFGSGVWKALETLPKTQREAVLLLKVTGLSLEETARATGITVGAVKQRAHRAFQTLRNALAGTNE